ncbi:MAG: tRNA (adenosine(37)-N6)-threonylcarbamoyltransferase complex dimerization subunit type 1 TsaB [Oscillatoriaceae bacterium SKW80]|nr:tRNA (adenosine(37)-N6)-threonylcarbamoyltransferase complex dimerization subunit type 1 TsaB [Oscillatoriaceae bacterium SKYG93]MCX8121409.1 tRNA (adenosine(37)-N6)-threonylcarbamoyltransferase complex dimerization subunit type 1 TsaB [Oscillatoriaceae bacterium SKW80]MDW8451914.1 tRNA (adenosine(37)-N6)-threonylcarbamoyltransferase complex dimerization subunit type 1 TsaB [Oscillatoriaceae cyanobacterium SKYGB_i_bin93]HIK29457.1 tRNA (adenosine(37)-N6)-threonylcarbamoyltransferase complex d
MNPQPFFLDGKKYALAIHATSPELGLAISNFAGDERCQTWNLGRALSTDLHAILAEFIKPQNWEDLAFVAVAKGPGSFTGTRIGVVTARAIAQQLKIPVFAISTLAAAAQFEKQRTSSISDDTDIAVEMPAQRGQIFAAIYKLSTQITVLLPDAALTPEAWQETLQKWPNPYHLIRVSNELGASVSALLQLAYLDWQKGLQPTWAEALPFYGQHPVSDKV